MKRDVTPWAVIGFVVFHLLFSLGALVGVIWVAVHFLRKFW